MAKSNMRTPKKADIQAAVLKDLVREIPTKYARKIILQVDEKSICGFKGTICLFNKEVEGNKYACEIWRFNGDYVHDFDDEEVLEEFAEEGRELIQEWDVRVECRYSCRFDEEDWREKKLERQSDKEFFEFWS